MLNENQKRSISSTLHFLEMLVDEIERLMDTPPNHGILFEYELPDARRAFAIQRRLNELKKRMRIVKGIFDLEARPVDVGRAIAGKLAVAWEAVEDTMPSRLRGYGALEDGDAAKVEEQLSPIAELLLDLRSLVIGAERDRSAGDDSRETEIG